MGYWLVLALVACALVGVMVAVLANHDEPDAPGLTRALGRDDGDWPDTMGRGGWVHVVGVDGVLDDEAVQVWRQATRAVPAAEPLTVVAVEQPMEPGRDPVLPAVDGSMPPAIVSVWTALAALLLGVSLESYQRQTLMLLGPMVQGGATILIGTVPDLAIVLAGEPLGYSEAEIRAMARRWNATVTRLATALGGEVVDLGGEARALREALGERSPFDPAGWAEPAVQDVLARRFVEAVPVVVAQMETKGYRQPIATL